MEKFNTYLVLLIIKLVAGLVGNAFLKINNLIDTLKNFIARDGYPLSLPKQHFTLHARESLHNETVRKRNSSVCRTLRKAKFLCTGVSFLLLPILTHLFLWRVKWNNHSSAFLSIPVILRVSTRMGAVEERNTAPHLVQREEEAPSEVYP